MASILGKPGGPGQFPTHDLSTVRGALQKRSIWRNAHPAAKAGLFNGLLNDSGSLRLADNLDEFGLSRRRSSLRQCYCDTDSVESARHDFRAGIVACDRVNKSRVCSKNVRFAAAQQFDCVRRDRGPVRVLCALI